MANYSYMTIKGQTQGLISKGCSSKGSLGSKCQTEHLDENHGAIVDAQYGQHWQS
ncbi:Uncharacterized protein ALO76_01566 [Pseudomonas syringae pv. coriandricola]|nr:Uncharacterized protein ALO76_01566 [Pseudomonas syringae pv. coriandricola]